jgi:hypothetical protein
MPSSKDAHATLGACIYFATLPEGDRPTKFPNGTGYFVLHAKTAGGKSKFSVHRDAKAAQIFVDGKKTWSTVIIIDTLRVSWAVVPTYDQIKLGRKIYKELVN